MMLEALPCGAVLLDQGQRIVFANAAAETLLDPAGKAGLAARAGKIGVDDATTDRQFQAMVSAALANGPPARGGHMSVRPAAGKGRLTISVTPTPPLESIWSALGDDDVVGRARCMVLMSTPNVARLAQHYGLTPAEARVVSAIAGGKGLAAAARELGIARSTAQSHLDKIFQKTGTNRQAELVGLVQAGLGS